MAKETLDMADKDTIRGNVKEAAGKLTGDDALERQGQTDQVKGKLKDAGEKVKDAADAAKDAIKH
jgi:uncharacterized protein YjbJ (UPF0337 family)